MLLMQAFGRHLVLEPYLATVVLGGTALRLAGSEAQQGEILPEVAAGTMKLAFAHYERQARYDLTDVLTTAKPNGGGFVLEGAKSVVLHGDCADRLIVSARTSGGRDDAGRLTLFLVDANAPGVARRGYALRDGTRAAELSLSGVQVPRDALLGEVGNALPLIQRVVEAGIAATAAESDRQHGGDAGHDARLPQDPRSSSASRSATTRRCSTGCGDAGGDGAGPLHGHAGGDVAGGGGCGASAPATSPWPRSASARPGASCRRTRCSCMAGSA